MVTITIDDSGTKSNKHFSSVEEFQDFWLIQKQASPLSDNHKKILDQRLAELEENPTVSMVREEAMSLIKRKPKN